MLLNVALHAKILWFVVMTCHFQSEIALLFFKFLSFLFHNTTIGNQWWACPDETADQSLVLGGERPRLWHGGRDWASRTRRTRLNFSDTEDETELLGHGGRDWTSRTLRELLSTILHHVCSLFPGIWNAWVNNPLDTPALKSPLTVYTPTSLQYWEG